jgi:alkylated DNA repair protein (DNA oxidative demethylase)
MAGLEYRADFISEEEERILLDRLMPLYLPAFRFHGWLGNRRTRSFGWRYDFDDSSFTPTDPLPDWLLPLRVKAGELAGTAPDAFVQALIARYDPGAGIGWHRDRDVFEDLVGVSLNTPASLRFRQRTATGFRRARLEVEPRSAYLLSREARHCWEHSIAPGHELRFSITFRALSEKGQRIATASRSRPDTPRPSEQLSKR